MKVAKQKDLKAARRKFQIYIVKKINRIDVTIVWPQLRINATNDFFNRIKIKAVAACS